MALMSSEDNNEDAQTAKTNIKSKYKHQEKKKLKLKTRLKINKNPSLTVSCERNGIFNLQTPISVPYSTQTMLSTYPAYTNYVYPVVPDWSPVVSLQNPILHLPVVVNPMQIVTTQICPYIGTMPTAISSTVLTPVSEIVHRNLQPLICTHSELHNENEGFDPYYSSQYEENYIVNNNEETIPKTHDFTNSANEINESKNQIEEINHSTTIQKQYDEVSDPLEFYLTLPKELFPAARTLSVDPNPIIDEFCKIPSIQKHAPWILDLEFGVPNLPITRLIPTYNVKLNSINCKNAPDAIHPGFESCNIGFKEVILFYYDCIISTWYRGYIILNNDRSVENFQAWLLLPAQVLGMCWS